MPPPKYPVYSSFASTPNHSNPTLHRLAPHQSSASSSHSPSPSSSSSHSHSHPERAPLLTAEARSRSKSSVRSRHAERGDIEDVYSREGDAGEVGNVFSEDRSDERLGPLVGLTDHESGQADKNIGDENLPRDRAGNPRRRSTLGVMKTRSKY